MAQVDGPVTKDPAAQPHKLDEFKLMLGQRPDADVAKLAQVSVATVKWYRKQHGIEAYMTAPVVKDAPRERVVRGARPEPRRFSSPLDRLPPVPGTEGAAVPAPRRDDFLREPTRSTGRSPFAGRPLAALDPVVIVKPKAGGRGPTPMGVGVSLRGDLPSEPKSSTPRSAEGNTFRPDSGRPDGSRGEGPRSDTPRFEAPKTGMAALEALFKKAPAEPRKSTKTDGDPVGEPPKRSLEVASGLPPPRVHSFLARAQARVQGEEPHPATQGGNHPSSSPAPVEGPESQARVLRPGYLVATRTRIVRAPQLPRSTAPVASDSPPGASMSEKQPNVLAPHVHLVGTMPDTKLAKLIGVGVTTVWNYRKKHGIPTFDSAAPTPPAKAPKSTKAAAPAPVPAPAPAPVRSVTPAEAAAPPVKRRRGRPPGRPIGSKIDAHAHLLGVLPDSEIARRAGVKRQAIGEYRKRMKAYAARSEADRGAGAPGAAAAPVVIVPPPSPVARSATKAAAAAAAAAAPPAAAPAAPKAKASVTPAPAPAASAPSDAVPARFQPWVHLLGVASDMEIARRSGIHRRQFVELRQTLGIAAAPRGNWGHGGPGAKVTDTAANAEAKAPAKAPAKAAAPAPVAKVAAPSPAPSPAPVVAPTPTPAVAPSSPAVAPVAAAPLPAAASDAASSLRAFLVDAESASGVHRFLALGADMADAASRAIRALGQRPDGPWQMRAVREKWATLSH